MGHARVMTRLQCRWRPLLPVLLVGVLAGVLAACSADGSSADAPSARPAGSSSTTAAPCPAGDLAAPPPGEPQSFEHGGLTRTYLLAVPAASGHETPHPLVVDLHGFASDGPSQELNTAMGVKGTDRGYIVVTPSSVPPEWNAFRAADRPDDYAFIQALLTDLEARFCVDPDRVYAAGHSNGSAFAAFLVCSPPSVFAAVAMVSATTPSTCPEGVTPSALAIAGTADPQVPYAGGAIGGSGIAIPPAVDTVLAYAAKYGCDPTPVERELISGVTETRYTGCTGGAEVALDTVAGGTHTWPGGVAAQRDAGSSSAGERFDATTEILDFFDAHPASGGG